MKQYILKISVVFGIALIICMPEICHMYYNHGTYGVNLLLSLSIAIPIAFFTLAMPSKTAKVLLLSIIWLLALSELFMLAASYSYFTAGEMMAIRCANKSEFLLLFKFLWLQPKGWWLTTTILFIVVVSAIICTSFNHKQNAILSFCTTPITCLILFLSPVPMREIFPYNIIREQEVLIAELYTIKKKYSNSENFSYNARKEMYNEDNEVFVLAIGESLRYHNFGMNGTYHRQTTPLLQEKSNIVLYNNCFSSAVLTQHSLPLLLSMAIANNYETHYDEGRIGKAFSEAGYKTFLVSNDKQLTNDGVHSYLQRGFDSIIYIPADSMASMYIMALSREYPKTFILIHYLGNHFFYTNRTAEFGKWQPDFNDNPFAKSDSLIINAYDNSVLYTDYVLSQDIEALSRLDIVSTFVFVSDHGDYFDERVAVHGHTYHPTKDEYHIPFMVWYSDEYAAAYPEKVKNMTKHKDEPVCADHVFWSVLDMADIRIDSTLQQEGMSIFGDTLFPHPRTLLLPDGKSVMRLD